MEERTPEGRVSPLLVWDILRGIPLFLFPGLRPCIQRGKRPAPRLGGLGQAFRTNGIGWLPCHVQRLPLGGKLSPKVTDEGAIPPKPFLVESHCPAPCRLYAGVLLLRWVPGRPLIRPGCAGPPSPRGEGFGRGTQKSSLKNPPKESFQIGARRWATKKTCARSAASPNPKDGASPSERF